MVAADDTPPDDGRGLSQPRRNHDGKELSFADILLQNTQYFYAFVLLFSFLFCAAWYSVFNAKKEEDIVQPSVKGPGGKPLPITKRKKRNDGERKIGPAFGRTAKNVFRYLAAVIFLSYVVTGVSMFVHAFWHENPYKWAREGLPWAGEWSVVCRLEWKHLLGSNTPFNPPFHTFNMFLILEMNGF